MWHGNKVGHNNSSRLALLNIGTQIRYTFGTQTHKMSILNHCFKYIIIKYATPTAGANYLISENEVNFLIIRTCWFYQLTSKSSATLEKTQCIADQ